MQVWRMSKRLRWHESRMVFAHHERTPMKNHPQAANSLFKSRRDVLKATISLPLAGYLPASFAQNAPYPSRAAKLIIPFPAGGATDYAARAIGNALAETWRQSVVPENRVGAGSTIGTEIGAKSVPDGYTLVMGIPAGITIAPHIYPKLGYDPLVDLLPVAGFATSYHLASIVGTIEPNPRRSCPTPLNRSLQTS